MLVDSKQFIMSAARESRATKYITLPSYVKPGDVTEKVIFDIAGAFGIHCGRRAAELLRDKAAPILLLASVEFIFADWVASRLRGPSCSKQNRSAVTASTVSAVVEAVEERAWSNKWRYGDRLRLVEVFVQTDVFLLYGYTSFMATFCSIART